MNAVSRRSFFTAAGAVAAAPVLGSALAPGRAVAAPAPVRDEARWQVCQRLARELLLVGPGGEDLRLRYLKPLIDDGLPRTRNPKRVLIVGAGITGLVASMLLKRTGHQVTIIEASGNRIGGRIKRSGAGRKAPSRPSATHDYMPRRAPCGCRTSSR